MPRNTTTTTVGKGDCRQASHHGASGGQDVVDVKRNGDVPECRARLTYPCLDTPSGFGCEKDAADSPMTLQDLLARYNRNRTELSPATKAMHRLAGRYLTEFFGNDVPVDRITRAMASDWRTALARGKLSQRQGHGGLSETSVCIYVRCVRTMLNHAVREDLIAANPFDRLKATAPEPDKNWKYVTSEELRMLLGACPNGAWRTMIALCRLAGLRRGEAISLRWDALDWDQRRLTIIAQKTGRRRVVPIEAELFQLLHDAFDYAKDDRVCPMSRHCLWRNFQTIRKRAGLPRWKDAFQVLRRNCETDWAQKYPQYAVSTWIGHDIKVSARHYLQVPAELYRRVSLGGPS